MSNPNPVPAPAPNSGLVPSGSTVATSIGGVIAVGVIAAFHAKGIDFPAGYEAGIAVVINTFVSYFHGLFAPRATAVT